MPFQALDHVGFTVSDLDRSAEWYTRLLGEDPFMRATWDNVHAGSVGGDVDCALECAFWNLPNQMVLKLTEYLSLPTGYVDMETYNAGNMHVCLITEDLQAEFARLQGHAQFRSEKPVEIAWGPYKGGSILNMRDPDGINVEFLQLPLGGLQFAD